MESHTDLNTTCINNNKADLLPFEHFTSSDRIDNHSSKESFFVLILFGILIVSVINSIGLFSVYVLYGSLLNVKGFVVSRQNNVG